MKIFSTIKKDLSLPIFLGAVIAFLTVSIFILMGSKKEPLVGSDTVYPIAGQTYSLAGAGISSSDTSIILTSFTITQTGQKITDADVSDTFYITLEPGSRARQELVSCTTVTQNANDTATLSGCTRGLSPITPYTASSSLRFAHAGGSTVIFSDAPQLFNQAAFKDNDETITGTWLGPTPIATTQFATKGYVDGVVTGTSTLTNDQFAVAATAGETISACQLVYFNGADQEWYLVDVDDNATYVDKFIGLARGAGTNGTAITDGVLLKGRTTACTGLSAGSTYYASSTAGSIGVTSSSQPVGVADDTNILYFDPVVIDVARQSQPNTFSSTTTFTADTVGVASTSVKVYTASGTWTKPDGLEYIIVEGVGGGGAGGGTAADTAETGGTGGGGGYFKKIIPAAALASSETVTIGAGATGDNNAGATGGTTLFGAHATATGGVGGSYDSGGAAAAGGAGGTATGGNINIAGSDGGYTNYVGASDCRVGGGGASMLSPSHGSRYSANAITGNDGTVYGMGGQGSCNENNNSTARLGGDGADGVIIIYEVY